MVADSAAAVAVLKLEAVGEPRGALESRDARHVAPGPVAAHTDDQQVQSFGCGAETVGLRQTTDH